MKLILPLLALLLCGCRDEKSEVREYSFTNATGSIRVHVKGTNLIGMKVTDGSGQEFIADGGFEIVRPSGSKESERSLVTVGDTWIQLQDKRTYTVVRVHQSGWLADGGPWLVVRSPLEGEPGSPEGLKGGTISVSAAHFMQNYRRTP